MNYLGYKQNSNRIGYVNTKWTINYKLHHTTNCITSYPVIINNTLIYFKAGHLMACDIITNKVYWKQSFKKPIIELISVNSFIYATDHKDLFIINTDSGLIIKKIENAYPNILSAIVYGSIIIWTFYKNNTSSLCYFSIETLEVIKTIPLSGLATYLLANDTFLVTNENPDLIKIFDIVEGDLSWSLSSIEQGQNKQSFINDYPFIIGDNLYITQFPDYFKSINLHSGKTNWQIKLGTGINSFASSFYNDKHVVITSGVAYFLIDYKSGKVIKSYNFNKIEQLKSSLYRVSYFDESKCIYYSYSSKNVFWVDFESQTTTIIQKLKDGLKTEPIIDNQQLILIDKKGNCYF